jgi:hypothetical protein
MEVPFEAVLLRRRAEAIAKGDFLDLASDDEEEGEQGGGRGQKGGASTTAGERCPCQWSRVQVPARALQFFFFFSFASFVSLVFFSFFSPLVFGVF